MSYRNRAVSGDLTGSLPSPTVAKLNGVAVTGTPSSGLVPTATGASAATWQAIPGAGGLFVSVKQSPYNATGNGATDDTAAIQAAITAVVAAGGGTVWFPKPGTAYRITTRLTCTGSNVVLAGEQSLIRRDHIAGTPTSGGAPTMIVIGNLGGSPTTSNVVVKDLIFDGQSVNTDYQRIGADSAWEGGLGSNGLSAHSVDSIWVQNCTFKNHINTGLDIENCGDAFLIGNVLNNVGIQIVGGGRPSFSPANGITIYGVWPGGLIRKSRKFVIVGNTVEYFRDIGIDAVNNGSDTVTITANAIQGRGYGGGDPYLSNSNYDWGITTEVESGDTYNGGRTTISGNVITECWRGVVSDCNSSAQNYGVTISGNSINDAGDYAMILEGFHFTVTGNTIYRYGAGGGWSRGIVNTADGSGTAMRFKGFTISGNTFVAASTGSQQCGIEINPAGTSSWLYGLSITGNTFDVEGTSSTTDGTPSVLDGIIVGARVKRCAINGNTIRNHRNGIVCDASYANIGGNVASDNTQAGILIGQSTAVLKSVVAHNTCVDNGQDGAGTYRSGIVLNLATGCTVEGNVCSNDEGTTQQYGVQATSSASTLYLRTGNLAGNAVGGLLDGSSRFTYKTNCPPVVSA